MTDYTPYQQKIIKRYYDNQDSIQLQRLSELVGELYLAEGKNDNGSGNPLPALCKNWGCRKHGLIIS